MKRSEKWLHALGVLLIAACVAFTVFRFPNAFGRLLESIRDLGISVAYYFCEMFGLPHNFAPTVIDLPQIPFFGGSTLPPDTPPVALIPDTTEGFASKWQAFWQAFIRREYILGYLATLANGLYYFARVLMFVLPFILLVYLMVRRALRKENNDYNRDTKPLRRFKWLAAHTYVPGKRVVQAVIGFFAAHRQYVYVWLAVWLLNFNIITVFVEFVAYYLYFTASFDIASLYRQVYKLFLDLSAPFGFIPLWVWGLAVFGFVLWWRRQIGYGILQRMEMRNRAFIADRPIVIMACGTMGKKKTTMITDMALSQEVMFRDKAFEKILENDLKFPSFPWINLEKELQYAMASHEVYNLASVKKWADKRATCFAAAPTRANCFDYDFARYGLTYNDNLQVHELFDVLKTYAQLYFIYVIQSGILLSNYSIRTDNVFVDGGNFPVWNTDFFKRDTRLQAAYSRHSHILDFDMLRLGKKVIEDNKRADAFEFGVVNMTEIGKERGNTLELREVKRNVDDTNQKNDGFTNWLKLVRHSATVDNFPFVKVITDDQRPTSWGADARELCDIVHIRDSGETRLVMPFFALSELLHGWLFRRFESTYRQYRVARGDNTLFMHLLKGVSSRLHSYYTRVYNTFSSCALTVQVESGTIDGKFDEKRYYLMSKKIYSKRFSTDCYNDYFTVKCLRSVYGLDDIAEYATETATVGELESQNSFFINELTNIIK
jgi:hypothetical protein